MTWSPPPTRRRVTPSCSPGSRDSPPAEIRDEAGSRPPGPRTCSTSSPAHAVLLDVRGDVAAADPAGRRRHHARRPSRRSSTSRGGARRRVGRRIDRPLPGITKPLDQLTAADHPAAARARRDARRASTTCAALPPERLAALLAGTLDVFSYRLDAWLTSLATRRLAELRATTPPASVVGGLRLAGGRPAAAAPARAPADRRDEPGPLAGRPPQRRVRPRPVAQPGGHGRAAAQRLRRRRSAADRADRVQTRSPSTCRSRRVRLADVAARRRRARARSSAPCSASASSGGCTTAGSTATSPPFRTSRRSVRSPSPRRPPTTQAARARPRSGPATPTSPPAQQALRRGRRPAHAALVQGAATRIPGRVSPGAGHDRGPRPQRTDVEQATIQQLQNLMPTRRGEPSSWRSS